jgi:dTDP-4-amino-4,6-dideoxygalactose transaminase
LGNDHLRGDHVADGLAPSIAPRVERPGEPTTDEERVAFHVPARPDIDGFLADVRQIVLSGWLSEASYVRELERRLQPWTGGSRVVAVSNCSDGLIAALSLSGVRGREVILPGLTFLATWQAIIWAGGVPVVADVDDRGLLDPAAVAAAITPATAAILAVHLAGSVAPMDALRAVADRHGLALIGDAAHAFGARGDGFAAGSLGDVEVFSIGATKQISAGEGGFLTVRTTEREAAARHWALQGRDKGAMDATGPGMNLRLSELTAALAIRILDDYPSQLARRHKIHERYAAGLRGLPLRLSGPRPGEVSAHKDQLVWLTHPADRPGLRRALDDAGIETKSYYDVAVPDLTAFEGRVASADRSRRLAASSFAIPIHSHLTDGQVDRVIDAIRTYFSGSRDRA